MTPGGPQRRLSELVARTFDLDPLITGITADSRKVIPGYVFAALPGTTHDGRAFIDKALSQGAAAIIAPMETPDLAPNSQAPLIRTTDPRRLYALAARAFWGAEPPVVVAVTGTNGKTSVATFCRQIFTALGHRSASLGTLGLQLADRDLTGPGLTTPDAEAVARMAAELFQMGVTHLAVEASSHGLDQRRLDGLSLKAAAFTNLTQDHLDYHGTLEAYRACKLRLFDQLLPTGGVAVLNADSPDFARFAVTAYDRGQTLLAFGEEGEALQLANRVLQPYGQNFDLTYRGCKYQVRLPLAGAFQAANALAAAGLCIGAGEDPAKVIAALEGLKGAPGRLQRVGATKDGAETYVDYAHTPDGLKTVLEALRPHTKGRLVVVFGAGGDRDRTKRPLMGEAAARFADCVYITDDNPRSEDPAAIRAMVKAGAPNAIEIGDRREAIATAVADLRPGDVLVVAGKGHEQGQTIGGVTHPFDDVRETEIALQAREGRD